MQRIEVLVDHQALLLVMKPPELADWINERRKLLIGESRATLAKALGVTRTQVYSLLDGKAAFGKRQIERYNALDPEFEIVQLIGVVRRKPV